MEILSTIAMLCQVAALVLIIFKLGRVVFRLGEIHAAFNAAMAKLDDHEDRLRTVERAPRSEAA